ncbi:ATP-binding protein [Ruminococcus sp. Marseille-P6503]|uniref:sensor histidine kinase n=1 Tax=Ruminococcus sp. Marseille-P6503 TaxID=2364796 RepID=UPI000F5465AB|nr:ATP-binding protein [Ruminococcus sp. Marseille-P6503]
MQKKIFRVMTAVVAVSLAVFSVVIGGISYSFYKNAAQNELKAAAEIAVSSVGSNADLSQLERNLQDALNYKVRLTYIESDGNVLYDSEADSSEMENHLDRSEVKQAMENGTGEATRVSGTLGKTVYYYAVQYDGGVLRFARERSNLLSIFIVVVPIIICAAGAIFVVTTVISIKLSESLIKPINRLVTQFDVNGDGIGNLETPYEELKPIIKNADLLMKRISKNVAKLKREKEKITLITDNMVEAMILLDSDRTVLSVNRSAVRLLNPHFDPHSHEKLSHLTANSELLELLDRLDEDDSVRGVVSVKNRSFRTYINKSDFNGDYGIIILMVDVTESLKSEQIRRDFSANVSHELKTPLTTIKGFGEMMENGIITGAEDIKKYGGTIYREAERLLYLINDIIRLSEIEEHANSESDQVDVLRTAQDVEEILQNKAYKHRVSVFVKGENVVIKGNQSYMTELLLNLMDNAVKYNNDGGSVWVEVSRSGGNAVVVVRDNGIGIAEKDRERVFERFYRVDKSRSKQTGGTGLGLSIVKHIVAYHNGEIAISSSLGKGTEITVTIPVSEGE